VPVHDRLRGDLGYAYDEQCMPELPEVEITARLLDAALLAVHFEGYVIAYCPDCRPTGASSRTGGCRGC
jgi:hypothetical protein